MSQATAPRCDAARWVRRYAFTTGARGIANRQSGSLGSVMRERFVCHMCVGSHVLSRWRRRNRDGGVAGVAREGNLGFGLGFGAGFVAAFASFSDPVWPLSSSSAFPCSLCFHTFLLFSMPSFLSHFFLPFPTPLPLVPREIGVLSSRASWRARRLSRLGTRFGLWLAVLLRSSLGTS